MYNLQHPLYAIPGGYAESFIFDIDGSVTHTEYDCKHFASLHFLQSPGTAYSFNIGGNRTWTMTTSNEEHSCRDDQKTNSDIERYGLSVIMIEASDYLPSFAYSIGLWKKFGHPELISFGLTTKTLHAIINLAADIVKTGQKLETGTVYTDFFETGKSEFLAVDKRNIRDYFGYAIDFYNTTDFPALQLVWTDRNDKFPWDEGFEEEFIYKQPLLDRNADFKFREPKNVAAFTTRQWLNLGRPILRVVHENDGDWQFLTGDQMPEDIKIVALEQLVLRDKTLNEVFDLGYGEAAERDSIGGRWTRSKVEHEEGVE